MRARLISEFENFTRGGDPYKKLNVGSFRPFVVGERIKIKEDIYYWSFNSGEEYDFRYISLDDARLIRAYIPTAVRVNVDVAIDKSSILKYNSDGFYQLSGTVYAGNEFIKEFTDFLVKNPHLYERRIYKKIHEIESFTRGGDPYDKLGIGIYNETELHIAGPVNNIIETWYIKRYEGDNLHFWWSNTKGEYHNVKHVGQFKDDPFYDDLNAWLHKRGMLKPLYFVNPYIFTVSGTNYHDETPGGNNRELIDLINKTPGDELGVLSYRVHWGMDHQFSGRSVPIQTKYIREFKNYFRDNS